MDSTKNCEFGRIGISQSGLAGTMVSFIFRSLYIAAECTAAVPAAAPFPNSPTPAEHIFWKNMRPAVGTTRVYEKPCNTNGACCTATWANIIFPRINGRPPARCFVNPSDRFPFPEERGFAICVPIGLLSHRRVGDGDPVSRHGRSATRSPLPSDGDVSRISYAFAYFAKV